MKRILFQGIIAGTMSAVAGIVYLKLYEQATMVDFSSIINSTALASASIMGCMLMAVGYMLLFKLDKVNWKGSLNILIMLLSFLSIFGPITMTLPLEFEFPELLPGLAIPMHFFPAMIFFGLQPFFLNSKNALNN
jgi:hypothetical protein